MTQATLAARPGGVPEAPRAAAALPTPRITAPAPVDELGPTARRVLTGGVLAAHVLGGWALLQVDAVRQAVIEAAPIMVSLIDAPAPPKPAPPPAPPAPPAQVAPAVPRQIPPSAVRYVVEPRLTVPLLSRRLGEQGLVHLRIVVDARGQLKEASLKKSSGFARIDQQALQDIRSARFAPYLDNGQPIEWETTALLSYELDR